jgi:hypothetical protein
MSSELGGQTATSGAALARGTGHHSSSCSCRVAVASAPDAGSGNSSSSGPVGTPWPLSRGVGSSCLLPTGARRLGVSVRTQSSKASHTAGSGIPGVCCCDWSATSKDAACSMQSTQLFVPRTGRLPSHSVEPDYPDAILPSFSERMLLICFGQDQVAGLAGGQQTGQQVYFLDQVAWPANLMLQ